MKAFDNEGLLQKWIEDQLAANDGSLFSLIDDAGALSSKFSVKALDSKILDSYSKCLENLHSLCVLSKDENISLDLKVSLKPDLLCYSHENQSFTFIELKALPNATREAGTELSAYSAALKSYIPFLSDGDINNVIISQDWPTLLTHCIYHDIIWNNKIILCLEPISTPVGIRLRCVDPSVISKGDDFHKFSDKHFSGYQICLYDKQLQTDHSHISEMWKFENLMKCGMAAMASRGEQLNSSGFAILWKDHYELSLAPYSVTLVNVAAMHSLERFYHTEGKLPGKIGDRLGEILKEAALCSGYGPSLGYIEDAGKEFFTQFSDPSIEGFVDWGGQKWMMEDRAELMCFFSWGVIRNLYFDFLLEKIKTDANDIACDSPALGMEFIKSLIDDKYEFIPFWERSDDDVQSNEDSEG